MRAVSRKLPNSVWCIRPEQTRPLSRRPGPPAQHATDRRMLQSPTVTRALLAAAPAAAGFLGRRMLSCAGRKAKRADCEVAADTTRKLMEAVGVLK